MRLPIGLMWLLATLSPCSGWGQQSGVQWRLSNTANGGYVQPLGGSNDGPFFDEGLQLFDDLSLDLDGRSSPYVRWRAEAMAGYSRSSYRSADDGFQLDRLAALHENGATAVPYRIEVGDLFAFYSQRTLQRGLKGAQLEIQPGGGRTRHSLVATAGVASDWMALDLDRDRSAGGSYLVEHPVVGRAAINLAFNQRAAATIDDAAAPARSQWIGSVAYHKAGRALGQRLELDGELAVFRGDHDSAADVQDLAGAARIDGRTGAAGLSYAASFEHIGADFRPHGAGIGVDRRALEGHLGYRFEAGLALRARAQRFEDGLGGGGSTTEVVGLGASGVLIPTAQPITGQLDTFMRRRDTPDSQSTALAAVTDITVPLGAVFSLRGGYDLTRTGGGGDTHRGRLGFDLSFGEQVRGAISPTAMAWRIDGPSPQQSLGGEVAIHIGGAAHRFTASGGYTLQAFDAAGPAAPDMTQQSEPPTDETRDVASIRGGLGYQFTVPSDSVGIDLTYDGRAPDGDSESHTLRVQVFWRHDFAGAPPGGSNFDGELRAPPGLPTLIGPGTLQRTAEAELARRGLGRPARTGELLVYEARSLTAVDRRQRLVLRAARGAVTLSAIIIHFDPAAPPAARARTFSDVQHALVDRLGKPTRFLDEGAFTDALASDLLAGRFVRVAEWQLDGGVVRFGVPRRFDGRARMEVHFTRQPPPLTEARWGLDEVR